MLIVTFNLYAPVKRCTRNRKILKARFDKVVDHFVLARFRQNKLRILLIELDQPVSIFAHPEEIAFFLDQLNRMAAVRAFASGDIAVRITFNIHELSLGIERLVRNTVPAFVFTFVDISLLQQAVKNIGHHFFMTGLGSTDEIIIGDIQLAPQLLNALDNPVNKLLRRLAGLASLLFNLLPMLIRTGQITDLIAAQPFVTGHRITSYRRIGMPDMQLIAWIIDRGR
ncbi:hypothetical protein D3C85_1283310 [compost metagenome]